MIMEFWKVHLINFLLKKCNPHSSSAPKKNAIYATLQMIYDGQKNYELAADENLEWVIDGKRYSSEIIQRLNQPLTRLDNHSMTFGDGSTFN